jgi:hypothetical protein
MSRGMRALIVSPIAILLISGARLLIVCNYDTNSALALAAAGGVVGTLVGTLLPLLPPYLPVVAILFALFRKVGLTLVAVGTTVLISPAFATARGAFVQTEEQVKGLIVIARDFHFALADISKTADELYKAAPYVVGAVVLGMLLSFTGRAAAEGCFGLAVRLVSGIVFAGIAGLMVLFVQDAYKVPLPDFTYISQILRRPWVPSEVLTFKTTTPRVGYVISMKDYWFVVMNERDRSIEYFHDDDVIDQKNCELPHDSLPFPLFPVIGSSKVVLPMCPVMAVTGGDSQPVHATDPP